MYTVNDETFLQARSIISTIARELTGQEGSGLKCPVDLQELVRRSASVELPEGGEVAYVASIADKLERSFPINELFPSRRTRRTSEPPPAEP